MATNNEKTSASPQVDVIQDTDSSVNLVYDNGEVEPGIHARTWVALAAMFLLNYVQVFALQGPPAVLNYIGRDLNATTTQTWIPVSLSLVQAVLGPLLASASDVFQARKTLLVASCAISFIGSAIAPGSQSIGRLIAAQVLIGVGFAIVPLAYCIPSEIVPRKWRPVTQGVMNIGAMLASISAPLSLGGLITASEANGWRIWYWIQMAIWGLTAIGIFVGYRPPKRHTRLNHLSFTSKLLHLDLIGFVLFTAGLTLLLVGLSLGGGLYSWRDQRTLGTLVAGIILCLIFAAYEVKGTKIGIMHHDLFRGGRERGQTFAICVALMLLEGVVLFSFTIFYPVLTETLFEEDAFLLVARGQPFWIAGGISTSLYGYVSTKTRSIKWPMLVGYVLFTAGIMSLATIEPGQSLNAIALGGLAGLGFGAPLTLIVAGVQLSTPHHLIATATAVTSSARAISATIFTAIYSAAYSERRQRLVPLYVAKAAILAGLSSSAAEELSFALATKNSTALATIEGLTPAVLLKSTTAMQQALADSVRVVFIIAAPFGALACILCFFLGDLRKAMDYRVDAPVEDLHAKKGRLTEQQLT